MSTDTARPNHGLRYVCKWCGAVVAEFPTVKTDEPATFSVCDKRACREAASAQWKAGAPA